MGRKSGRAGNRTGVLSRVRHESVRRAFRTGGTTIRMKRLLLLMAAPALLAAGCAAHDTTSSSAATAGSAPASTAPAGGSGAGDAPGTPSASASASPGRTTANPTPAGTPRCHTKDLTVRTGDGDGAAGTQYLALVFTNTSGHACTLYGYPGVSWVAGDDGHQVGDPFTRDGSAKKVTVKLAPGKAAHATIATHDVGFYDAAECKPVAVRGLRIYPPDETNSIFVALGTKACSAKAVNVGRVQPITTGTTS